MATTRRQFVKGAAAGAGAITLGGVAETLMGASAQAATGGLERAGRGAGGYGPLAPKLPLVPPVGDPAWAGQPYLALPDGFEYVVIGIEGTRMDDGRETPWAHDGMAAFRNGSKVRLVRNHEDRSPAGAALGTPAYDPTAEGGTTTLQIGAARRGGEPYPVLERSWLSIAGTVVNCAGGPTPWGSWLTCEESTVQFEQPHGYVFEVPAAANRPVDPVPLKGLGRFVHEAIAIDPRTGIVYETEDRRTAGFYRFVPDRPGRLEQGGTLQMLAVSGEPQHDTRTGQVVGQQLPVTWVDIPDPDPSSAAANSLAVFEQGYAAGGALFARLEGCWWGDGSVYFNATTGGDVGEGQVWQYVPHPRAGVGSGAGVLRLVFESPGESVLDNPDNITVAPSGGLLLCEDGDLDHLYLRGLTKDARIFDFAQNLRNEREWAGACFERLPQVGQVLFVNFQGDTRPGGPGNLGFTFAIWGPWDRGAL